VPFCQFCRSFCHCYAGFSKESDTVKKKKSWLSFAEVVLPNGFQQLVMEAEARSLLMDCAVERAVACAREEFRISKPAKHCCDTCGIVLECSTLPVTSLVTVSFARLLLRKELQEPERQVRAYARH
jgi:hypothetical protein